MNNGGKQTRAEQHDDTAFASTAGQITTGETELESIGYQIAPTPANIPVTTDSETTLLMPPSLVLNAIKGKQPALSADHCAGNKNPGAGRDFCRTQLCSGNGLMQLAKDVVLPADHAQQDFAQQGHMVSMLGVDRGIADHA